MIMKKILITLLMGMFLLPTAAAQMDTVQWKCNRYHYSVWYDTLPAFFDSNTTYTYNEVVPALKLWDYTADQDGRNFTLCFPHYVDRPTNVYGVAVTETMDIDPHHLARNPWHTAEYVYLFQKVGDSLVMLDSARWDTVPPKVMKWALNADTDRFGFELSKVYEAMFDKAVLVDSVFYTATSRNGDFAHCGSSYYATEYYPVVPTIVDHRHYVSRAYPWCPFPSWWTPIFWNTKLRKFYTENDSVGEYLHYFTPFYAPEFGMFFPIVDYVELIVTSADTTMGTAGPVAHVARNTSQTIWATPRRGYKFSHWQEDWGIHARRSVYVTQDTTRYTAVFEPAARYTVQGVSDAEGAGYVTLDDSVYYEGDTAVLEAYAAEGMKFRYWSTGSTENPLRIAVESDTVVMAHFTELERYRVIGVSSDEAKGYVVVDDSVHLEDDTATLAAFAEAGYEFSSWSTGGRENPLRIVVESDTVVMAFFAGSGVGIADAESVRPAFVLSPNPARGRVEVELAESAAHGVLLNVQDAAGRVVVRRELALGTRTLTLDVAELPAGTYFVTLVTKEGTATRRLVVE